MPELAAHDLAHLDAYQAAARLVAASAEQPAFTLRTRLAPAPLEGRAQAVRTAARRNFGRTQAQRRSDALGRQARHRPDPRRKTAGQPPYRSAGGSPYASPYDPQPVGRSTGKPPGQSTSAPTGGIPDSRDQR